MEAVHAYDNSAVVTNADEILQNFIARSQQIYQHASVERDIPYGNRVRERLDWFHTPQEKVLGTLVFIHGGYWQACRKEEFAFIAEAPLALGYHVVLLEYSLAPEVTLTTICQQIGHALDFIALRLETMGLGSLPLLLSGHSAGGHLAAYWHHHPRVDAVFPISGIFALSPLQKTSLNQALQLTVKEISVLSPLSRSIKRSKPQYILYGELERPALINQSQMYHHYLSGEGVDTQLISVDDCNHFDVLAAVFAKEGELTRLIATYA